MDRRRLLYFLLLNALVSACVTGTIIFWYDRNLKATSSVPAFAPPSDLGPAASVPEAIANPSSDVQIVSVVGADNLGAEVAILRYLGEGQVDLSNWQLKDEDGNLFLFPAISLVNGGAVQIHTAAGTNTVVDLYWNLSAPVWKSGETASLYDASGNLIVTYKVP
ncbi:MAG: lamin tail domain-containing protein [Anaerolineaceae bacterium]|nr:MAG: lamin tail domain-containing protein [Anaerolineaceae bacterium]